MQKQSWFLPMGYPADAFWGELGKWISGGFDRESAIYGDEDKSARGIVTVPADHAVNAVKITYEQTNAVYGFADTERTKTTVTYTWGFPAAQVQITRTNILINGDKEALNKTFPSSFVDRREAESSPLIFPPNPCLNAQWNCGEEKEVISIATMPQRAQPSCPSLDSKFPKPDYSGRASSPPHKLPDSRNSYNVA